MRKGSTASPQTACKKRRRDLIKPGKRSNFEFANCELQIKMRKHNGMRPQDVVILLKIIALEGTDWRMKDIALALYMSPSEVTESLERSATAALINADKTRVMRDNLHGFLVHGLRYVFPVQPGPTMHGLATAHAAAPLSAFIVAQTPYVWSYLDGPDLGPTIKPLMPAVPRAAQQDPKLYALLALTETLRVGHVREKKLAAEHLEQLLWSTPITA
jgi:hypothetical protein